MYNVYLKKSEEKRIIAGHPWVYANEVARIDGKDKNGSLAAVYSSDGRLIGKGYINHLSKILVRIFIRGDETDDEAFYARRIKEADDYRKALGYKNSYRMVYAEADNLPAITVDKYGDYLAVQLMSLGADMKRDVIVKCLVDLFSPKGIYERSDEPVRLKEGLQEQKGLLYGEIPDFVEIEENGVKMLVDIINGQKTGYFLDQKENRLASRRYAAGKTVLDCFCNSGGFSMNAALTATAVTAVDISQTAINNVIANARLNGFSNVDTVCADVFEVLRKYKNENKRFGLVVLDPPAFCKSAAEINDACRGYRDINILGMKLVERGGFLITSSCSHYMSFPLFEKTLIEAAKASGRRVRCVEIKSQAPDHPSLLAADETQYLKFFVLQII